MRFGLIGELSEAGMLGRPGVVSIALLLVSVGIPLGVIAAAWCAARAREARSVLLLGVLVVQVAFAAVLVTRGWIPLWTPGG